MCEKEVQSSSEVMNPRSQKPVSFVSLYHELFNQERPCPDDTCGFCDCAQIREQHRKLAEKNNLLQEARKELAAIRASLEQMPPGGAVYPVVEQFLQFLLSNGFDLEFAQTMRALLAKGVVNSAKFEQYFQEMVAKGEVDPIFAPFVKKPPATGANPDN